MNSSFAALGSLLTSEISLPLAAVDASTMYFVLFCIGLAIAPAYIWLCRYCYRCWKEESPVLIQRAIGFAQLYLGLIAFFIIRHCAEAKMFVGLDAFALAALAAVEVYLVSMLLNIFEPAYLVTPERLARCKEAGLPESSLHKSCFRQFCILVCVVLFLGCSSPLFPQLIASAKGLGFLTGDLNILSVMLYGSTLLSMLLLFFSLMVIGESKLQSRRRPWEWD